MNPRAEPLHPRDLTDDQAAVYRHIAGGPRANGPQLFRLTDDEGRLNGPFDAMLRAPGVGDALQSLGAAIRYGTDLSDRVREMAILAVATHWNSQFERYAHEPIGRAAGLTDDEIHALRTLPDLQPADPTERAALEVVRELLTAGDLSDAGYDRARGHLGEATLVELTTLVGYYATLAMLMRVFRVSVPLPGTESTA